MSAKSLSQVLHASRAHRAVTALKVVTLVLAIWGIAYPALLWGLGQMLS
ncbi:MAG: hypothetical protein ACK4S6_04855 [Roseateles asaccharophilus]|jgi:K+-transporting ATPase c subunit|uniref:Uncharacterized protein n=1 Tax=Roseateles asaccharophilus TaxID=582607 RepID=A0A4R6NCL4_9BURK|nr:hypothetical protein [Roseateles asaccharophilus]MDN3542880.1 hypothetical protein [Roseateles asaccharophilus]TDP13421.1 hypothetical protein DFR39_101897 [Roseateles asaccharophilus]